MTLENSKQTPSWAAFPSHASSTFRALLEFSQPESSGIRTLCHDKAWVLPSVLISFTQHIHTIPPSWPPVDYCPSENNTLGTAGGARNVLNVNSTSPSLLAPHHLIWSPSSCNEEENLLKGKKDQGTMDSPEGFKQQMWMVACWKPSGPLPVEKVNKKTWSSPGVSKFFLNIQQKKPQNNKISPQISVMSPLPTTGRRLMSQAESHTWTLLLGHFSPSMKA